MSTGEIGIHTADVAPARAWALDLSDHFTVHSSDPINKDENLNDTIQRYGAHLGGWGGNEADWYHDHKGYLDHV